MDLTHKRILIIKPSSLGDVVHALPVVHAIKRRYPTCYIGWIVQRGFRDIIHHDPAVDEVIPIFIPSTSDPNAKSGAFFRAFTATLVTMRELRRRFVRRPYDLVLDLHASFRSGMLGTANPGGLKLGFADAKELNPLFAHEKLVPDPNKPHAVDRNLIFAEYVGSPAVPEDFHIAVSPAARDRVQRFLAEEDVPADVPIIYANPAARWETKFWTIKAWSDFADMASEQIPATVIFAGGPDDVSYIRDIETGMRARPVTAAGKLNLADAAALLERSSVYVGVDSGPMHMAAFSNIPVVALFGPTEPEKVGPYGAGHVVLTLDGLDCLGCRKRKCPDRRCLDGLSPQKVFRAVKKVLDHSA